MEPGREGDERGRIGGRKIGKESELLLSTIANGKIK